MTTRRIAHWWFRFVFSGRFLDTFLGPGRVTTLTIDQPEPSMARREVAMTAVDEPATAAAAE